MKTKMKTKRTRIAAALLAALLLTGTLAACDKNNDKEQDAGSSVQTDNPSDASSGTQEDAESSEDETTYPGISTYEWKHADNEVMFTIDGKDYDFATYRYYLMALKGNYDGGDDSYWNEETEAEFKEFMLSEFKKLRAIEKLCEEKGIVLSEEETQSIDGFLDEFAQYYGEETLREQLDISFLTRQVYIDASKSNALYGELMGTYVTDQDILSYAKENYVHVKHVLVGTLDEEGNEYTGEALDEKTKLAQDIAEKAKNGEDFDGLVKQYGEDPGMEASPEGYTFTYGMMVQEFEDESFRLSEGEVSEPIKTSYGYHIIQKLPLDEAIFTNPDNQEYTDIVSAIGQDVTEQAVTEASADLEIVETDAFKELTVANIGIEKK